jgi:cytochrome P450
VLTRYADIVSVLRSPAASSERVAAMDRFTPTAYRPLFALRANSMINCDPQRHNRLRTLVSKAFTARAVEAMTPGIQHVVDQFIDGVQARRRMDLIADLACPLPVTVIAQLLGVPAEDRGRFKQWSDDLAVVAGGTGSPATLTRSDYRRVAASYGELAGYLGGIVARRRAQPRDNLLTALARAEEAGDRLNEDELYANATLLLVACNETTTNLIDNGVLALLRHPDQMAQLRTDPSLVPAAVEELLRYDSPVQFTIRLLKEDLEVGDKKLCRGQMVLLLLLAGNRDPEQFPQPDRLDFGRAEYEHLSFGLGSHFYLGAQLARLEGRIALETLLRRLPEIRLEAEAVEYRPHFNLRGLKALPVTF